MTRSKLWGGAPRFRWFCAVAVMSVGCDQMRERVNISPTEDVELLVLRVSNGSIEVTQGDKVQVDLVMRAPAGVVEHDFQIEQGGLTVSAMCTTPVFCAVDAVVQVPVNVDVRVEMDHGEVWATGIHDMNVILREGVADLDVSGNLTAQVGRGLVRAIANEGQLVRIAVADGDIDLRVPQGVWSTDVVAAEQETVGVTVNHRAMGRLELVAPSGRVRIQPDSESQRDSGVARLP
jgi:hypothetical protein